ncbi:MAG: hypothetical protein JWL73_1852 [Actinomycetia bacterium]|nr:hypothetical protein [Actinomycetes bacterium]
MTDSGSGSRTLTVGVAIPLIGGIVVAIVIADARIADEVQARAGPGSKES